MGRGSRARRPEPESSETSDTDDASVSPTAFSVSSEDTSDDDDYIDSSRRNVGDSAAAAAASRSVDEDSSTYSARQHSTSTRSPRQTSSSSPSVLRLKIKKRLVSGRPAPKRDGTSVRRKTPLVGRKLSGKVGGKTVASSSSEVGSPEVKRCRPAHWSPVHSGRQADVWLPPPGVRSLMDKVSITDVTANTLTVTVRECTTGEGFFRQSADTEPAAASSSTTSAEPT